MFDRVYKAYIHLFHILSHKKEGSKSAHWIIISYILYIGRCVCKLFQVRNARPMIDNKPPQTYMHLHLNLKKLQVEEERRGVVERDNSILLDKMARIMRTKGSVDNVNNYEYRRLEACTVLVVDLNESL